MPQTEQADARTDLAHKDVGAFEIKDAEKGEVEAIIATCGVIDKDFDIISPTAIKDGSKVKVSSYGHDVMWGEQPVGKGALTMDGDKVVFRGRLFLSTQGGRETFEVLKEMGKDQEWSFGFRVMGSEVPSEEQRKRGAYRILTKLDCFEVSPVIRGAGEGTRTVAVKEEKPAEPPPSEPAPAEPTLEDIAAKTAADAAALAASEDAKRVADRAAIAFKAASLDAAEEFQRIQRTHRRLGLTL